MEGSKSLSATGKYPWLIYNHCKGGSRVIQTFCTKTSTDSFQIELKSFPELQKNKVVSCSQGWLLLSDNDNVLHYSIWNPTASESIDLPRLVRSKDNKPIITSYLLSSAPSDPNCLILLFPNNHPVIIYCRPGDEQWAEFNYEESTRSRSESLELEKDDYYILNNPVSCNGKIYAGSSCNRDLVLINVDKSSNIHSVSLFSEVGWDWYHSHSNRLNTFLVESGDQLFSIKLCIDGSEVNQDTLVIEVDVFNFVTNSWEKVRSGNGWAIFLGSEYSVSCPIPPDLEEEFGSYIYFTKPKDETLYSYRIEDETLTQYLPCPNLPKPWHLLPTWIMPPVDDDHNHRELDIIHQQQEFEEEENSISGEAKEGNLCDMPSDIIGLIAGNLSFVDYINFRCVNRLCASSARTNNSFSPCLVFSERSEGVFSFVDSNMKAKYSVPIPDKLRDYTIRYSKENWLLMDKDTSLFAFNPLNNETIQLPDTPHYGLAISSFISTSLPSSSDSLAIGLVYMRSIVYAYIIKGPGDEDEEWCDVELENDPSFQPCFSAPVFYLGSFYYIGKDGRLGVVLVQDDGEVDWRVLDKPRPPCKHFRQHFLAECDGGLLSVFLGHKGNRGWIRIFKLNPSGLEEWEEISTLGCYSLYLSRSSSFAAIEERPNMANRIYFPRFYQDDLVYYSLNTKKYHSVGREDSLANLFGTRMPMFCAWIAPTTRYKNASI
ncbi:hypothetical protein ACH5RR_027878 [Cinchona calisaya]|uniref:F-box protein n=1 Tax=Cinchona calisaya TaxID=153742 RepID=A0ABD2YQE1_9GENT